MWQRRIKRNSFYQTCNWKWEDEILLRTDSFVFLLFRKLTFVVVVVAKSNTEKNESIIYINEGKSHFLYSQYNSAMNDKHKQ
jgi:hypothetical protein